MAKKKAKSKKSAKAVKSSGPAKKKGLKKKAKTSRKVAKKVKPASVPTSAKASVGKKTTAGKPAKKIIKKAAKKTTVKKKKITARKVVKPAKKSIAPKKKTSHKKVSPIKKEMASIVETVQHKAQNTVPEVIHVEKPVFVQHKTSLKEGSIAPYFEGPDQNGNIIRSSDLLGKNVILYFYPKDHTDGCTAESCSLRDEYHYFNDNNYIIIGVSADSVESHKHFAADYILPFSLIADTDKKIIHAYDVWGPKHLAGNYYDGIVRTTFVIDTDGIIKHIVTKVDSANHAQQLRSL